MDIIKLIYEIKMAENGEQAFRNWLFGENTELKLNNESIIKEYFGKLRNIITNNLNVTNIYEATSEKYIYTNVVMCDSFSAHNYLLGDIYLFINVLYLVFNGILNICYDANNETYFISSYTCVNNISNTKTWRSGSEYQIEHKYEYKKGKILYNDMKIFTFNVKENITIKDILIELVNN